MTPEAKAAAVLEALAIGTCPQCGQATTLMPNPASDYIPTEACRDCHAWILPRLQYAEMEALIGHPPKYAISR